MTRINSTLRAGKRRPSGTTMVEAAFVLVVFLGFMFLIIDVSWGIFAKLTLQHAVRSGVRYAVTSQVAPPSGGIEHGQEYSIKQVVQRESMGLLTASDLNKFVNVKFYSVSSINALKDPLVGTGANAAGNLVVVSVVAWPFNPIGPLLHSSDAVPINVSSGDLIESSGSGQTPPKILE